jgi:hypothetical protein
MVAVRQDFPVREAVGPVPESPKVDRRRRYRIQTTAPYPVRHALRPSEHPSDP